MEWVFFIVLLIFCATLVMGMPKVKTEKEEVPFYTKARLSTKIDEMPNYWLCVFEKDGEKVIAFYSDDNKNLAVGDEVNIAYREEDEAYLPLVKKPQPEEV